MRLAIWLAALDALKTLEIAAGRRGWTHTEDAVRAVWLWVLCRAPAAWWGEGASGTEGDDAPF